MSSKYSLVDVILPNETIANVIIENGFIIDIGTNVEGEVIPCAGLRLLPGLVDLHTHLREPGKEDSETVLTGSQAAVLGGYTAISAMANTLPVADTAGVVEQVFRLGKEAGLCDVFPIGAVTQGLEGERLAELGAMADSAAHVRVFSDDGKCVSDSLVMRRALEYVKTFGGVIAQHAQDPRLTVDSQMNEGVISGKLGLTGWPAVAEESIIARDILLADHVKSRLHICHLTTKGGVDLVRWAKARGINVTAEVTPHHLLLTDELATTYDAIYKVNPPLRTHADVEALRKGVADGTIDIIATDHAPHPTEDKECEWNAAAFGMLGLESALPVVVEALVRPGHITWERLADVMSLTPAKIGGYTEHIDGIKVGAHANLTLVNTSKSTVIDRERQASKSKNTPFHGMTFPVAIEHTIFNGVFVVKDGVLTGEKYAE